MSVRFVPEKFTEYERKGANIVIFSPIFRLGLYT